MTLSYKEWRHFIQLCLSEYNNIFLYKYFKGNTSSSVGYSKHGAQGFPAYLQFGILPA